MTGALLVCLKWVALRPEIDPLTGSVAADARFSGPSPADWSTLEWALRLAAEDHPVHVVTVGPADAESALLDALAAGAASALRIAADDASELSSREVARELATVARSDVGRIVTVCTGDHSLDRGSGSVPGFLAAELGWPQALGLVSARREGEQLIVERRLDQGRRELLAVHGPAVVSFEAGLRLRRASLAATLSAGRATVEVMPRSSSDGTAVPPVIGSGPYRPRPNVKPAPVGDTRSRLLALSGSAATAGTAQVFEGSADEAAELARTRLIEWGYLEEPGSEPAP